MENGSARNIAAKRKAFIRIGNSPDWCSSTQKPTRRLLETPNQNVPAAHPPASPKWEITASQYSELAFARLCRNLRLRPSHLNQPNLPCQTLLPSLTTTTCSSTPQIPAASPALPAESAAPATPDTPASQPP